jgi:hypothetical protein
MFPGESGGRASKAWATCPEGGDNAAKAALIPDVARGPHGPPAKGGDREARPLGRGPCAISLLGG